MTLDDVLPKIARALRANGFVDGQRHAVEFRHNHGRSQLYVDGKRVRLWPPRRKQARP